MARQRNFFYLLLLIFVMPSFVSGQDENDIADFQRFFSPDPSASLETVLQEATLKADQAAETSDGKEQARTLRNLGLIYLNDVHDYEKALDLFIRALAISDSLKLADQQVLNYVAIARVFEIVGDYFKSAQFLQQSLTLNRDRRNINADALILNNLGKVNASRGETDAALANFQQVLRYKDDIERLFEAEALFNIAHLHTLLGNYDAALDYHRKALGVSRARGDKHAEATSLNDIGVLYSLMRNDEKSQANHKVALEIRQRLGDKPGMAESYNNIGTFYLRKGNHEQATANGLLALENGRESGSREQMLKSYDLLSQAYKELGDFRNALQFKELAVAIQDFIQSEKQERQLLETQNRYVVGKKEAEIQKLNALRLEREREIAEQKKFRNILFLVVALVLMSAGLLLVLYMVKRRSNRRLQAARNEVERQNAKLQQLNSTKDKFFSIISHDLKGPLNSLTSFSRLLIHHTDSMSREEIQLLAKDLDKSVKNLLTLLENLLDWSRSQTGNIDFTAERLNLTELLENNKNLLQGQAAAKKIDIILDANGEYAVTLHKNSINTVIRNLMSNAIKFTPEGGTIRAGITADVTDLKIFIADTGVGMSPEVIGKLFLIGSKHSTNGTANEKGTGLGLILCREFVEKNGGRIAVESIPEKGSVFTCSFPKSVLVSSPYQKTMAPVSIKH